MLLSLLWGEIVADDMMMFSVKVMKLLIWNVLLKLNSKSYHVVKEKGIIYDAILKTRRERNSKIFFFLSPCLVLMRRGLARMVENVMWKFQKSNFASSFHQYSNSCEEYFGGARRIQGRNISQYRSHTKEFLNRPNLNKICDRFGNGLFFPMYYLQKQSQQFKERTRWVKWIPQQPSSF